MGRGGGLRRVWMAVVHVWGICGFGFGTGAVHRGRWRGSGALQHVKYHGHIQGWAVLSLPFAIWWQLSPSFRANLFTKTPMLQLLAHCILWKKLQTTCIDRKQCEPEGFYSMNLPSLFMCLNCDISIENASLPCFKNLRSKPQSWSNRVVELF
jgi:hypothetical protein